MKISVQQVEAALDDWRERARAHGHEVGRSPQVYILGQVHALMMGGRAPSIELDTLDDSARRLLEEWRARHH